MTIDRAELRALVREVVRDAVADVAPTPEVKVDNGIQPSAPRIADDRMRVDQVRIANDRDLDAFVRQLLRLFENPKTRADLRNGRLTFRLAGAPSGGSAPTHRIDSGAVTERQIIDIASSGGAVVLGRRAVLTPLAREKARALGVSITKERR